MATSGEQVLPVVRVAELPSEELAERWLVEQLWCAHAVGVIGGAPKCAKTWLGLDMALSVAGMPYQSRDRFWSIWLRTRCELCASVSREWPGIVVWIWKGWRST